MQVEVEVEVVCNECGSDVEQDDCYCAECYQKILDEKNDIENELEELKEKLEEMEKEE